MKKLTSVVLAGLIALAVVASAAAQTDSTAHLTVQAASDSTLFVRIDNVDFGNVNYNLGNTTTSAEVKVTVQDGRGNNQGWNVTIRGTNFAREGSPAASFSINHLALSGGSIHVTEGMQADGISAIGISSVRDQADKIASASPGKGMGGYVITYPATLTVPGGTPAGDYRSTLTVAINSGP